MVDFGEQLVAGYRKGGRVEGWKKNADRIFDREWVESVVNNLDSIDWLPKQGGVLVSPSANIATHEKWLTEMVGSVRVIAGDLAIDKPVDGVPFAKWNAKSLPMADGSADVIWDMRGALWHMIYADLRNDDLGGWNTRQLLEEYARVLKPSGLIVIDDDPTGKLEADLGKLKWTMVGSSGSMTTEMSTGMKIGQLEKKIDLSLPELAGGEFEPELVLGEGRHRVRVYRKR